MKNIAVTGYYGTGSSAVVDLLSEHNECTTKFDYEYEHVPFYNPGGLFDLEWKLLFNNDLHRSNEALRTFQLEMKRLNDNNFGWFGSYKKLYGNEFHNICDEFVLSLVDYTHTLRAYADYKGVRFSVIKVFLQMCAKILHGRKIHKWGRKYVFKRNSGTQMFAMPSSEKFYAAAKNFTASYANMISRGDKKNIVFDHLVFPHQLNRVDNFFDNNFGFICVDRDPRDLFVLNKYIWKAKPVMPLAVEKFCSEFLKLRNNGSKCEKPNTLYLNFEDLVYHHDDIIEQICKFSGIEILNYGLNKKFNPEESINNTQNFLLNAKWVDEIKFIEDKLGDYIYNFPSVRVPIKSKMFD